MADRLGIAYSSAQNLVTALQRDGVISEMTGRRRGRVYVAVDILALLSDRVDLPAH